MLPNMSNYGFYKELVETGKQTIYTKDLNKDNIEVHWSNILSILYDGIERRDVQMIKIQCPEH